MTKILKIDLIPGVDLLEVADGSPGSLNRLLDALNDARNQLHWSQQHAAACKIDLSYGYHDDPPSVNAEVYHEREQSACEAEKEARDLRESAARRNAEEHERERRQYETLRAKFGS